MDTETSSTKQSARERLGLEKPTSNRIGVVSTKVVSKNPVKISIQFFSNH